MMCFGAIPYKRAWYCNIVEKGSPEIDALCSLLDDLKKGAFHTSEDWIPFLSSDSADVRKYAVQLFADVCSHGQVDLFERALQAGDTIDEMRAILLRLGQTLSLEAIPILLAWRRDLSDSDTDEYVCQALRTILPLQEVDDFSMGSVEVERHYGEALSRLDRSLYYYRGNPVFVGDVTKELLAACYTAYNSRKPCVLVTQPQILSNFSGLRCPVAHGDSIIDLTDIFDYVKTLAAMQWTRGIKYFFRRAVH
jgi:hypothetical protein